MSAPSIAARVLAAYESRRFKWGKGDINSGIPRSGCTCLAMAAAELSDASVDGSDSRRDLSIALGIKEPHPLGCVGLVKWNDAPSTTYKKVLERLRKAANP